MNAGHEQFDNSDDEQRAKQLLGATFAAPPMSADFVSRLSRELDQEFALSSYYSNGRAAKNGVAHTGSETIPITKAKVTRRAGWRIAITAAVAASLMLVLGIWSGRPAYGWATMIEALENCQWVQAITQSDGTATGQRQAAIAWFSQQEQIAAQEVGESRVFLNFKDGTANSYSPEDSSIYQRKLADALQHMSQELLRMLLFSEQKLESTEFSPEDFEVVEESWARPAQQDQVELRVTLRRRGAEVQRPLVLEFLINAETHLPTQGRVVSGQTTALESIEFSYPNHGPQSIYSLGVAQDVPVLAAEPIGEELAGVEQTVPAVVVEKLVVAGGPKSPVAQPTVDVPTPAVGKIESAPVEERIASVPPVDKLAHGRVAFVPLPEALSESKLVEELNSILAKFWQSQGITPAEPATDAEFLRRVYLDLTGRIPAVSEVYAFLEDHREDRREQLVDDLLHRRDHATHLAAVWRTILLPDGVDFANYGGTNKFDSWLADRFGQNLPYDQLTRQLLLAEGRVSESGPLLFFASLKLNPEEIAAKTSRVFLGTRMECAQCHDHPFDDRISQTDFWGFAAHFAQISRPEGKMEMTSPVLRVHDNNFGDVKLPDKETVVPPHLPDALVNMPKEAEIGMSRRRQLVDWLTTKNNDAFSRAAVNRVWQQLFGRGLVEPVDDMRPDNKPVCPEAFDLLARDFAASGFDLRRLLRALVLTDAYQLSSGSPTDEPSQSICFARMNMKSFTADQLYDCIAVATLNDGMAGNVQEGAIARTGNSARQSFIEQFQSAPGDRTLYQAGVPQALTLMHGMVVNGATDLKSSGLLKSLNAPFFSDEQRLSTLFLATLSREPEPAEREELIALLSGSKDDTERLGILGDILWALLNSAEFTFIH